jgi:hypothetical protein
MAGQHRRSSVTLPVRKIPAGMTAEQAAVVASQAAAETQQ